MSLAGGVFTAMWTAVSGADRYEVQHRIAGGAWTPLAAVTVVSATYAPAGGTTCGTTYEFRARSHGDGLTHVTYWGTESAAVSVMSEACNEPPAFDPASYEFEVAENAAVDAEAGTVSATDPDDDALTYAITVGDPKGQFAVDGAGVVTVAAALDHETDPSYTLTVEADDQRGGTAEATVTVTVTDVAEDAPPAPGSLSVALSNDVFTLTWDAVTGASAYEAQHTTDAADAATVTWTALAETAALTQTYSPADGAACGTVYRFRVRAYGDGVAYTAMWGSESAAEPLDTGNCPPQFGRDSYDFFIRDTAAADSAVGRVTATAPDDGDTVTYAITAGNDAGKFAVNNGTGRLTVAGTDAFNLAATPSYTLTVEARDGNGGTAMARVTVALTLAACANGTVVPQSAQQPRLVRDCSVLLTAKDALRGTAALNWSADTPIVDWVGVRRWGTDLQYVRTLALTDLGLNGTIPAALGSLEDLEQLYLFNNQLTGSIPVEFEDLRNLHILSLYDNDLTGEIPAELGKLTRLRQLLLDGNQLTGALPEELGDLAQLEALRVPDNQLTGAIPAELADLPNLNHLFLEGNSFTGCIPQGLRDVDNHDLDRLGLADCSPPAP